uniref:Peptidase S1 domain-containing protein n=1 Tax=Rhodnius prolixus TaxID=13249 RepID=T1IFJ7_RHOPR
MFTVSCLLYHEFHVVTAASCFYIRKVRDRQAVVIFGVDDYTVETVNEVGSIHVWLHPEYDAPTRANDIALIELRRSNKMQMDSTKIVKVDDYSYQLSSYGGKHSHSYVGIVGFE